LYDAAALTNVATIAAKAGETDRAIELANRADALEPDHLGFLSHQKAVMLSHQKAVVLSSIDEVLATTGNVQDNRDRMTACATRGFRNGRLHPTISLPGRKR
jgi:hypothetical protein